MSHYEPTTITPGEQQTGLTTEESYGNIDPSSANYQQAGGQKSSMLGKLKDKTKKAGSAIKSKVGKKKHSPDATGATTTAPAAGTGAVGGEEMEDTSSDDSSDGASSPAVQSAPYTGPASVPREFGTYPTPEPKEADSTPAPDMSGLSLNEKASERSEGAKDSMYGGAAATAAALGVGGAMSRDDDESKPVSEKASDASSMAAGKAEDAGRGASEVAGQTKGTAYGTKDAAAEKGSEVADRTTGAAYGTKDAAAEKGSEVADRATDAAYGTKDAAAEKGSEVADQTKGAAYETKDAAQSKAADLNNATDDSQTYTEKASNTATVAKDTVAEKLGMSGQPASGGPSVVDQAKGYFGAAVDTTKEKTGMNQPASTETGPSLMDKAKGYFGSTVDTTKEKTGAGVDTTKDYAAGAKDTTIGATGSAADTTKDYATRAKDTVTDATTPKDEHKALSEKITDSLSGLTATAPATPTPAGAPNDETNPGILSKLTGMLGYAPKAPEDHLNTPSSGTTGATSTTATQ